MKHHETSWTGVMWILLFYLVMVIVSTVMILCDIR